MMLQRTYRRSLMLLAVILAAGSLIQIRAQGGPPMITDDTGTVEKGHFEINTAFTVEVGADGQLYGVPLVDFNYGTSSNTQIKIEIPWLVLRQAGTRNVNGLGNTNIGVRWRFRDEKKGQRVALSIYPQIEFNNPTSSVRKGLVDRGPEFLMPLQIETHFGKLGVNGDIGYRVKRGDDEVIYGVVVGREFKRFQLLAEIHGTSPRRSLAAGEIVYNFGTRIPLTKHATAIISAGRSIRSSRDPRFIGYGGIQWTF